MNSISATAHSYANSFLTWAEPKASGYGVLSVRPPSPLPSPTRGEGDTEEKFGLLRVFAVFVDVVKGILGQFIFFFEV